MLVVCRLGGVKAKESFKFVWVAVWKLVGMEKTELQKMIDLITMKNMNVLRPYTVAGRLVATPKQVEVGKRGGLRYKSPASGRWVYLKQKARTECVANRLARSGGSCAGVRATPNRVKIFGSRAYGGFSAALHSSSFK